MISCDDRTETYFGSLLSSAGRISRRGYVPSKEDILHIYTQTLESHQTRFERNAGVYVVHDPSDVRFLRWTQVSGHVHSVIFLVDMSNYDQGFTEDGSLNFFGPLKAWDDICNSKQFEASQIVLFLNKSDIFESKILKNPLHQYFPDYRGENNLEAAKEYICRLFLDRTDRKISAYFTNCTDGASAGRLAFEALEADFIEKKDEKISREIEALGSEEERTSVASGNVRQAYLPFESTSDSRMGNTWK